ncbi:hypothetical protein BCY86_06360 [Pajaroellobacter abortibovis]|uniref:Uncharacterized protein n=1 Tax=Pajaroellobacter abortibovis TaxID=1882918 RepID=A0A1L6MXM5_9BACT|nr:hypothetical protein BCY86_06360 [Pajaroellobacter abortibovis]
MLYWSAPAAVTTDAIISITSIGKEVRQYSSTKVRIKRARPLIIHSEMPLNLAPTIMALAKELT